MKFLSTVALGCCFACGTLTSAQTTEGLIAGRVIDEVASRPIRGATVTLNGTGFVQSTRTDGEGYFSFVSLSPGAYQLKVAAPGYRPSEIRNLSLPVSGLLVQDLNIRLFTSMWQTGMVRSTFAANGSSILPVYGPDVDLSRSAYIEQSPEIRSELAPSLSRVVTDQEILNLPLEGRDPYALLVLLPNVTNDVSTQRGLGVSANGQRPSSASFLLDGFQNNNYITTGVFAEVPPETIEEYCVSVNNFSAEFGGTSGYIANAVTRSSTNNWHGQLYADVTNQSWNSASVQQKLADDIPPSQQINAGGVFGGALWKDVLFSTTSIGSERARSSGAPETMILPTQVFFQQLRPGTEANALFSQFPGPVAPGTGPFGTLQLRPTVSINEIDALQRIDFSSQSGTNHAFLRLIADRFSQPDFIWSPYRAFQSGLDKNETGLAFSDTVTSRPNWSEEFRVGYTQDFIGWDRAHADIPLLYLPSFGFRFGSPASFVFHDAGKTIEAGSNFTFTTGAHAFKWGGSYLERWPNTELSTPGSPTEYEFNTLSDLLSDHPDALSFTASQSGLRSGVFSLSDVSRQYRYWQLSGYLQDTYRVSERFLIHVGLRYEYYSPPVNIGSQADTLVQFGSGPSLPERIQNAAPVLGRQLYNADARNWAPRIGFAYNLEKNGALVFRGSYGVFYDRPFDNLWLDIGLNDSIPVENEPIGTLSLNYLSPLETNIRLLPISPTIAANILQAGNMSVDQTLFQPGFRTPYTQSFFGGFEKRLGNSMSLDVNYAGALSHELLTTDVLNRMGSTCQEIYSYSFCRFRYSNLFGDLDYRGNQGDSSHNALVSSFSVFSKQLLLALNYTWSHTIDNQSEPLAGFAANVADVNLTGNFITPRPAEFTRQFDSSGDRGNSDFDERHVIASYFLWNVPEPSDRPKLKALFKGWMLAGVSAFRTGSPFTAYAPFFANYPGNVVATITNIRADLVDRSLARTDVAAPGGMFLLNSAAFAEPSFNTLGTAGRNAFYGPGAYNIDLSLNRTFAVPRSERLRLTVRMDAFNVFNHANLGNPVNPTDECCTAPAFALSLYGRTENSGAIPLATPLTETARQIHFVLRLTF